MKPKGTGRGDSHRGLPGLTGVRTGFQGGLVMVFWLLEGRDTVNSASVISSSILPGAVCLSPGGHGGSTAEGPHGEAPPVLHAH